MQIFMLFKKLAFSLVVFKLNKKRDNTDMYFLLALIPDGYFSKPNSCLIKGLRSFFRLNIMELMIERCKTEKTAN